MGRKVFFGLWVLLLPVLREGPTPLLASPPAPGELKAGLARTTPAAAMGSGHFLVAAVDRIEARLSSSLALTGRQGRPLMGDAVPVLCQIWVIVPQLAPA